MNYLLKSIGNVWKQTGPTPAPYLLKREETFLRDDVTEEEIDRAILRELSPDLPQNRRRYLEAEGFLD